MALAITKRLLLLGLATVGLVGVTACSVPSPAAPSAASAGASTDVHEDAMFCVSEINRFRATLGLRAFDHSQTLEDFSKEAARVDGEAHEIHKHFYATQGGGVSRAQNEIPWWSLSRYGSAREVIRKGIQMEWDEGPGGYHYETLTKNYSSVGCGVAIVNGEVTVTHDFR